jgi:hypothetical protein
MYKYTTKILFCFLIFLMPYMNLPSKSMDIEDYDGSGVHARKANIVEKRFDEVSDVSSFSKLSVSSVKLEDSLISWTSYLCSPAKMAIQGAYDVVNFTTQNPRKAMIIGVYIAYQVTSVAAANCTGCYACNCDCSSVYGKASSLLECVQVCNLAKRPYSGCYPIKL